MKLVMEMKNAQTIIKKREIIFQVYNKKKLDKHKMTVNAVEAFTKINDWKKNATWL